MPRSRHAARTPSSSTFRVQSEYSVWSAVNGMRGAELLGGELTHADEAHLAFLHQLLHRADALLHRHVRVRAVLVVEVDALTTEALEAIFAGLLHVLRSSANAEPFTVGPSSTARIFVATVTLFQRSENALASSSSLCPAP